MTFPQNIHKISDSVLSFQKNNIDTLEIIGNQVDSDKNGKPTLEGYKSLAQAMNIYSDKRFETARYLFIKDGQIIRHLTVSTQTPSSTIIKPDDSFLYKLKNYAEQTDSKIVFLHNHPSGFVMPSDADIELTDYMTNFFKKSDGSNYFSGHIILDHGNYGLYTSDSKTWEALIDNHLKPLDELYKTYSLEYGKHKIRTSFDETTKKITEKSLLELSEYARKCDSGNMWNKKNWVCAALINNQGIVTSLEYINNHELQNQKLLSDKLKTLGRSYGSENIVLLPYTSEQFLLCENFAQKTGKVKEVFHQKTDGTFETSSYSNGNIFNDLKKDDIVIEDTESNKEAVFNKLIKNRKSDKHSVIKTSSSYKQNFNKAAEPLSNNKIAAPVVPENYFFKTTGSISSMQKSLPVDFNIPFEMTSFDYVSAIYIKNSPFVKIWNQSVIIPLSKKFQKQNYEIENILNDSFKNLDRTYFLNKNNTFNNDIARQILSESIYNDNYIKENYESIINSELFINKFGDWKKAKRLEKLKNSLNIEITGKEIYFSDNEKLNKKNTIAYGKNILGTYKNADTMTDIMFTASKKNGGLYEILEHDYKDLEHLQSIAAIPEIIKNSIFIYSCNNEDKTKNPNVLKFEYYLCGLKIGSVDYTVKAVITNTIDGKRYYDHKLTNIEKVKLLDVLKEISVLDSSESISTQTLKPERLYLNDKRLYIICQVPQLSYLNQQLKPSLETVKSVLNNNIWTEYDKYGIQILHDNSSGTERIYGKQLSLYFDKIMNTRLSESIYPHKLNAINNLHSQSVIKNINSFEKEDKTMIKNIYLNMNINEIKWETDENGNRTFTDAKGNSFSEKDLDNPLINRFDFDSLSNDYIQSQKFFMHNGNSYEYEFVQVGDDTEKQTIELFVSIPDKDGNKLTIFRVPYLADYFNNFQNEDIIKEIGKQFNENAVYITHQLSGEMLINDFNYHLQRNSLPDREHLYESFTDNFNSTLTAYYTSEQQAEIKKHVLEKTLKYSAKSYEESIPFYKEVLEQNPVETEQEIFAGIKETNSRKYGLVESEQEANRIKELHGAELHTDVMQQLIEAKKYYDNNKDDTWKDFDELVYCRTAVGRYTSWQQSEIEQYFMDYFEAENHEEVLHRLENFLNTEIAIENGAAWELDDSGHRILKDTSGYTPEMKQTAMENMQTETIPKEVLENIRQNKEEMSESQEKTVNDKSPSSPADMVLEEEPPMEMNYSVPDEEKLEKPMDISFEPETASEQNQPSAGNEQPVPVTREEFEQLQNNLQTMLEKIQQLEQENELLRRQNQALSDPTKIQKQDKSASDSMTEGRTSSSSGSEQPVEHLVNQDGFGLETAFTPNQIVPKFGIGEEPDIVLYDKARFKRIERDENNELNNKVVLSVLMPNGDDKEIEIPEQRYMKMIKASEDYEAGKLRYAENSDLWKKNLIDYKLKMLTDVDSYRLNTPENFMHNFRIHCKRQANNVQEAMAIAALMVEKMHPSDRATFNRMVDNVNKNNGENFYQNLLMKEYDKVAMQKGISEQSLPKSFEFSGDNVLYLDMDKDNIELKHGETIGNTHTKVGDSIPMSFTMKDFRGKKYKTPKSEWKIAKVSKNMKPDMAIIYNEETKSTMRIKLSTLTDHIQKIEKIQAKEAKKQIKKENKKYGYEGHEM